MHAIASHQRFCWLPSQIVNNLCVHTDAFAVMVSRICGILGGCLISLFLSVLVFPTSASQKATNGLSEGLEALTSLSRMAWGQEGKSAQAFSANSRFFIVHHSPQFSLIGLQDLPKHTNVQTHFLASLTVMQRCSAV